MILKEKLIKDWKQLMRGFSGIATAVPQWKVTVNEKEHVIINNDWDIICYFVNNEYIEAVLSYKGEVYLTVRHFKKYSATTSAILEFINMNS